MVLLLGWFGFVNFILPSVQDHVPFNCAKLMLPYLPRLFAACGLEDDLLPLNRLFIHTAAQVGVPLHYHEESGGHEWFFWQRQIEKFILAI